MYLLAIGRSRFYGRITRERPTIKIPVVVH
jgi:hypothetical protein